MEPELVGYCVVWNKVAGLLPDKALFDTFEERKAKACLNEVTENGFPDGEMFPIYRIAK